MGPRLCFCLLCVMIASICPSVAPYGPQTRMLDVAGIRAEISNRFEPNNDDIVKTAVEITKDYPGQININQINEIHKTLKSGWSEQNDPPGNERYFYANQTLRLGEVLGTIGGGDCDDFAILMSSLIEALGGATRVTFAWTPGEIGHVYTEVYLGNESDPHVDELLDWIKSEHGLSDIPGKIVTDGEVWLNLDWFADHPGGPYEKAENRAVVKDPPGTKRSPEIIPVIDAMEDASVWETGADDKGSSIEIKTVPGAKGNALEISYDLKEDGWVKISRDVDPKKLAGIEGLEFSYKSGGARNEIELGMAYDESTTFGVSWRPGVADEWSSLEALNKNVICLRPGDKCTQNEDFDRKKVRRLEFNISNNHGRGDISGFGTITIDQLHGIMFVPEGSPFAEVEKERQKPIALELAAKSETVRDHRDQDLTTNVLLAVESMRRYPTPEGDLALRSSVGSLAGHVATMTHEGSVDDIAFSPDGEWIATASDDKTGKVWNAATGDLIATMTHESWVNAVAFSPDGKRVATASEDKTAKVWNAANGDLIATMIHESKLTDVAFSPEGERVVTTSYGGAVKIWNASTADLIVTMTHGKFVDNVEFSPDGERVVTAGSDWNSKVWTAKVWNATSGDPITTMPHESWVNAVAFSPDGKRVATASEDKTAKVWNAATGDPIASMTHEYSVDDVEFSPEGKRVVTASSDLKSSVGTAKVWNAVTGDLIATMTHEDYVWDVEFSPDGERVVTASMDWTAKIWDASTGDTIVTMIHEFTVHAAAFSPNGKWVATASGDDTAKVWNADSCDPITTMTHEGLVNDAVFSPDGERVATASNDRTAKVWNAATGDMIATMSHESWVNDVEFSPDGERIATASYRIVTVWNASTGDPIANMTHGDSVDDVEFSPDGEKIATVSYRIVTVWDASTSDMIATMTHGGSVDDVAFSPDGERIATACNGWNSNVGTAEVWNTASGNLIATMIHEYGVNTVEFSPDGKWVATASYRTARVWNASTGDPIATMTHEYGVNSAAFSPDGEWIATASYRTAKLWHWRPEDMIEDACSVVERGNLTEEEWNLYLPGEPYRVTCDLTN